MIEEVVLVNEQDEEVGVMEKMQAHKEGKLHRAFSVFLFNAKNEMLLQKRASSKYHSPDLWTNACCSHPRPDENVDRAAARRLSEELGITDVPLYKKFSFIYNASFDNGLTEHELDYVFVGRTDVVPVLNLEEASHYKYVSLDTITEDIKTNPNDYTVWFKIAYPKLLAEIEN
jgi:isopentenyl-diphosphate Delta-isomerase